MNKFLLGGLSVLLLTPKAQSLELSARDIMAKNDEVKKLKNVQSDGVISTTGGSSPGHIKEFTWWRKLKDSRFNTLTRFHKPAEVKGEGILFLEQDKGLADVQLYLPNFKKIRRVEQDQQSGSFMASEFSYSDIAAPHVDDFTYKLLKTGSCPSLPKLNCFVIESLPATDQVKERTGASRGVSWIREDNFMGVSGEYYDLDNNLWKKMTASQLEEIDPENHKWMALEVSMENVKTGRKTILKFSNVKTDKVLLDSLFTPQNLARE